MPNCLGWLCAVREGAIMQDVDGWSITNQECVDLYISHCPFCGSKLDRDGCSGEIEEKIQTKNQVISDLKNQVISEPDSQYSQFKILAGINKRSKKYKSQQSISLDKLTCINTQIKKHGQDFMRKIFDILFNENKNIVIKGKKEFNETEFEEQEIFIMEINKILTKKEIND